MRLFARIHLLLIANAFTRTFSTEPPLLRLHEALGDPKPLDDWRTTCK